MKIKIVNDAVPDGDEVMVSGLGTLRVGEVTEISDQQVEEFRKVQGHSIEKASPIIQIVTDEPTDTKKSDTPEVTAPVEQTETDKE